MKQEQILYLTMVNNGMDISPGVIDSIKESIDCHKIHFFHDKEGKTIGFLTWYFEGDNNLVVNNLVILKGKRGLVKLFSLREMFHRRYPNLNKVTWYSNKRKEPFEVMLKRK